MTKLDHADYLNKAANIKLVVFDVDGVLTNGNLILGESGDEYKSFHVRDGHGLVMLLETGCHVAVITARSSKIVAERMQSLGIKYVFQGEKDKGARLQSLIEDLKLERDQVAYVGDDVIDLPAMTKVGLSIAVSDAHQAVRDYADWVTENRGGNGAAREVCETIMQAQGKLEDRINAYLSN